MRVRRIVGAAALSAATVLSFVLPASAADAATAASATAAWATAASATAASATAASATAAAVSAAGSCGHAVFSPDGGAMACFNPTGEHLFVCDTDDDGHHPGAWYVIGNGIDWHNPQYNLGAGDCHDIDLDLSETSTITYQACNYEGTRQLSCSSYALVSAKG
jgi:hypothetical protein